MKSTECMHFATVLFVSALLVMADEVSVARPMILSRSRGGATDGIGRSRLVRDSSLVRTKVKFPVNRWKPEYRMFEQNILKNETLYISERLKIFGESGHSNCYRYDIEDTLGIVVKWRHFCYPSIIVAGHGKCGTSAAYQYFSMSENSIVSDMKENCAGVTGNGRTLTGYLGTLPHPFTNGEVTINNVDVRGVVGIDLVIGGCIKRASNHYMADLLKPSTTYVYLVRNYADWLWSGYNFWCSPGYDINCTHTSKFWANSTLHHRSPELFHDIVVHDKIARTSDSSDSPLTMLRNTSACVCANGNYRLQYEASVAALVGESSLDAAGANRTASHIDTTPQSKVVLLASEQFHAVTEEFRRKVQGLTGLRVAQQNVSLFNTIRINTQGSTHSKGTHSVVSAASFQEGLYAISDFRPMLKETVAFLNNCWKHDCEWTTIMTGYDYHCSN